MLLTYKHITFILILTLLTVNIQARRHPGRRGGRVNVKNNFTHGGLINNWVLMMPVKESDTDSNDSSAVVKDGKIYRDQLLDSELFDSTGRLINRNTSVWAKTRSHTVSADSLGWVTPKEKPYQFYYAYSTIEAHVSEGIRLFLLGRGVFRIWLNGKELTEGIGAVTGGEPLYFDASIKQGDNSLLILYLPDGKNSFLLEIYPRKKALEPFKKRLDSISIDIEPYIVGSKILEGSFSFNIPVPEKSFSTNLILSTDSDSSGSTIRVLDSISPNSKFTFDIPKDYRGVIKLSASTNFPSGRKIMQEKFIWIGDIIKDFNTLRNLSDSLSLQIKNLNYSKIPLEDFLAKGISNWTKKWFEKNKTCKSDRNIRELGYVSIGCNVLNSLIHKNRFHRCGEFPIYTDGAIDTSIADNHYDHVNWLNYKYPDKYKKSKNKKNKGYEMWVSMPPSSYRKNKKLDMILYLHDLKSCNNLGISCMRDEGPNLINKRKSIVLAPLSENGILWDESELSLIIKNTASTKRIKRCFATGEGMGGFETYNQLILNNDILSAGVVLNAFTTDDDLCKLKDKPLWIFHGNSNSIVPVENSLNTVNSLKECGNRRLKYSVFSEDGENIGPVVYEDPVTYKWLFKQ